MSSARNTSVAIALLLGLASAGLAAPAQAGFLSKLPPPSVSMKLLGGRLEVLMPPTSRDESTAGDPDQSKLVAEVAPERLTILAQELYATQGKDFASRVRRYAQDWPGSAGKRPKLKPFPLKEPKIRAWALVFDPPKPEEAFIPLSDERPVPLMGLLVGHPDGSIQSLGFFINPHATVDIPGARTLAEAIAATVRPGPRSIDRSGGVKLLQTGFGRDAELTVPADFVLVQHPGPDFIMYRLEGFYPLGSKGGHFGIYFGGEPHYHHSKVGGGVKVSHRDAAFLGQPAKWHSWTAPAGFTVQEAIVPFGEGGAFGKVHVFLDGWDKHTLHTLTEIAGSLRVAPAAAPE